MPAYHGEVWLIDLGYVAKVRPCLVLSDPPADTDRALVSAVPHTTSPRSTRFECQSNVRFLKRGAFDAQNLVTISMAKLIKKLGDLPDDQLEEVEKKVSYWLGLQSNDP